MTMIVKQISKARFDALTFSKHPFAAVLATEIEWYADINENVLGSLIQDLTDQDWNYIVLGRDERGLFRWIDGNVSFAQIGDARRELLHKLQHFAREGKTVFPQGEARRKKSEIFRPIVPEEELNPHFKALKDEAYSPARELIQEIAYAFVDLDGNFIQQFQTEGFNSRLWELYLYAYLHEELFVIDRTHPAPDFTCIKAPAPIFIEAVTVNPSLGFDITTDPRTPAEIEHLLRDYMPIKYGSALYSKMQKAYWTLDHVRGKPLILAVHDFHREDSMTWSASALSTYLYGVRFKHIFDAAGRLIPLPEKVASHRFKGKEVPSGFFLQTDAAHISAVLFSNSATLSKFNRMGRLADFGSPRVRIFRIGLCHNHQADATRPLRFLARVEPGKYEESWGQGLSMFHNPNALQPIHPDIFPGIAHHIFEGRLMRSLLPEFFPYTSKTLVFVSRKEGREMIG